MLLLPGRFRQDGRRAGIVVRENPIVARAAVLRGMALFFAALHDEDLLTCLDAGAHRITVHPRRAPRHIRRRLVEVVPRGDEDGDLGGDEERQAVAVDGMDAALGPEVVGDACDDQ